MDFPTRIILPETVRKALDQLADKGFLSYVVGGCVRDSFLGKTPSDWDLCTSAVPDEICSVFSDFPTILTGAAHGTVTVLIREFALEITTFRKDGIYLDHRRPENVTFSEKLSEDLSRRDFTINAMAYSEAEGLIDIFGGKEDLQNGLIRSVGESRKRFAEDALRILRAVRLSSVLDFKIETKTSLAMVELAHTLSYPSAERKCSEFSKLLVGSGAAEALRENQEVLFALVPELCPTVSCTQETPNHFLNVFEHTLLALEAAPKILTVRLAVLFHDIGKPRCKSFDSTGSAHFYGHAATSAKMAEEILNRFRFEKKIVKRVCELVIHHDDALPFSPKHIKRLLATMGDTAFLELLEVKKSDIYGQSPAFFNLQRPFFAEAFSNYERIKKEHQCFSLSQLAITGDDLLQLGFTKDRRLGEALHTLLMAVIDGELPNQKKALLYRAEILKAKKTSDH